MTSGPDTLSQSLFDMLYAELFFGLRAVITQAVRGSAATGRATSPAGPSAGYKTPSPQPSARRSPFYPASSLAAGGSPSPTPLSGGVVGIVTGSSSVATGGSHDDLLDGEQYVYRILRLLYLVSNSKVCQKSLSTPKWLTLLIFSVGCGSYETQRRILRLLRRLLSNVEPAAFLSLVPALHGCREEVMERDQPLEDDDVVALVKEQEEEEEDLGITGPGNPPLTSAERLVKLFLEGAAVCLPCEVGLSTNTTGEKEKEKQPGGIGESTFTPVPFPLPSGNDLADSGLDSSLSKKKESSFLRVSDGSGARESLSTECIVALRGLQTVPAWRDVISSVIHRQLQSFPRGADSDRGRLSDKLVSANTPSVLTDHSKLRLIISALGELE